MPIDSTTQEYSNGVYRGSKGFDVDPPPSYISYNNNLPKDGGDKEKGDDNEKKKGKSKNTVSSEKDTDSNIEKKVDLKPVPFLSLVSILSITTHLTLDFNKIDVNI